MRKRIGRIQISSGMIAEFLKLSSDEQVVDIYQTDNDRQWGSISINVTGVEMPIVSEDCDIPIIAWNLPR